MTLARGDDWNGRKTRQTGVLYIAGEGVAGLGIRLRAYIRARGMKPNTQMRVVPTSVDFPRNVEGILHEIDCIKVEAGWTPGVIVLDTLARTAGGLDENSSQMTAYIEAADALIRRGMLVAVLHHPGKDGTRGMRGWSGLRGAVDVEIELTVAADGTRTITWKKQKDAAIPEPIAFRLQTIETGERDDLGEAIRSCVLEYCSSTPVTARARPRGDKQMLLYGLLGEMLRASRACGQGGAPADRPCVPVVDVAERWRSAVPGRGGEPQYFRRVLMPMIKSGLVSGEGEWLWSP
jgi:hypothetical protein